VVYPIPVVSGLGRRLAGTARRRANRALEALCALSSKACVRILDGVKPSRRQTMRRYGPWCVEGEVEREG
jgi:hypothetical protein